MSQDSFYSIEISLKDALRKVLGSEHSRHVQGLRFGAYLTSVFGLNSLWFNQLRFFSHSSVAPSSALNKWLI